jgi:predicted RNA-binding protein with PIN domain
LEEYLILDGYNVINSWPRLKSLMDESLETARDGLIDVMLEYGAFRGINVIILFDAHLVKGNIGNRQKLEGIEIVFTKEYETADSYIERYIIELSKENRVAVVTDDKVEQQMILGSGAIRIPVREMIGMFDQIKNEIGKEIETNRLRKNTLSDALDIPVLKRLEKLRRGR